MERPKTRQIWKYVSAIWFALVISSSEEKNFGRFFFWKSGKLRGTVKLIQLYLVWRLKAETTSFSSLKNYREIACVLEGITVNDPKIHRSLPRKYRRHFDMEIPSFLTWFVFEEIVVKSSPNIHRSFFQRFLNNHWIVSQ